MLSVQQLRIANSYAKRAFSAAASMKDSVLNRAASLKDSAMDAAGNSWTSTKEGDPNRPMRSALGLLDEARGDIAAGTDETGHVGLQMRALHHVDEAREILRHAMHEMEREHEHRY